MEKSSDQYSYTPGSQLEFSHREVPLKGVNFDRDSLSELEAVARATGHTVEEVIENNRLTGPAQS